MRTYTVLVVLALTFAVGCGDNSETPSDAPDVPDTCGNGVIGPGEQCDDGAGNGAAGRSCTATCQWACELDAACDDGNPCNGAETCSGHVCAAGTALAENASCGTDKICRSNTCVSASCGDGVRTASAGEECDDGNTVDGDGCDSTCRFSCVSSDTTRNCTPGDACAGQGTCNDATHICAAGTPLPDDAACAAGPNNFCKAGVCTAPMCGNTVVERGEDCEGGGGCKADCTFVCGNDPATDCAGTLPAPTACEKFACTPTHTCETVADQAANGNACDPTNPNNFCSAGACTTPVCGNGVREPGEQCDDGEQINLDGCDSTCKFEEDQRITSLRQQFATDAFCQQNALGTSITPDAQPIIQGTWDLPVSDGTLSIVFKFLGLLDLTGGDTPFTIGFVNASAGGRVFAATPTCPNQVCEEGPDPFSSETAINCPLDCTYDGNNDLDWWYVRDPASVDATETPLVQLPGQITGGHLTAGPGTISLKLLFALQPSQVTLFDAKVDAVLTGGPVNAPTASTTGTPPGHLASEHLSPTLTSIAGTTTGAMCSNVSLASLFNTPIPNLLLVSCTKPEPNDPTAQIAVFTPDNRLLDAFITGCDVFGIPGILPTQPDGSIDGATYHFAFDPATRALTSCTKDGAPAQLTDCVNNATYSSYFQFSTDRVIIKRN